jgi:hypothetical protein
MLVAMARALCLAALMVAAAAPGCGSSSPGGTNQDASLLPDDGSFLTCATDTRAVPYQPGMHVTSSAGTFTIKLLGSVPGPPVKGNNTWTVEIDEAGSGAPLDGIDLSVMPWMPDHGHGTTPVAVTAAGSGTYTLAPVYLYMAGLWQIRLSIAAAGLDGGISDNGVLPICIP